jgi:hypothetical protein
MTIAETNYNNSIEPPKRSTQLISNIAVDSKLENYGNEQSNMIA